MHDWYLVVAVIALAGFAAMCAQGSVYLNTKTHNERLARLVDAIGRVAGDIKLSLQSLPQGASIAAIRDAAINAAMQDLRDRLPDTINHLDPGDKTLRGMIRGELGKIWHQPDPVPLENVRPSVILNPPKAPFSA